MQLRGQYDIRYVQARNKLIPQAESLARGEMKARGLPEMYDDIGANGKKEKFSWHSRLFHKYMGLLTKEVGLVAQV